MDKNVLTNDLITAVLDNLPNSTIRQLSDARLLTLATEIKDIIGFHTKGMKHERQFIKPRTERTLHA